MKFSYDGKTYDLQTRSSTPTPNKPKCPTCGSEDLRPIGTGEKVVSTVLLGIFSEKRKKQFHCNSCGYEW